MTGLVWRLDRPWRRRPGEATWHALSPTTRRVCLDLVRDSATRGPVDQAVSRFTVFELSIHDLLKRGALPPVGTFSLQDIDPSALELFAWLAVTGSRGLLGTQPMLRDHMLAQLSHADRAEELVLGAFGSQQAWPGGSPWDVLEEQVPRARWLEWALPRPTSAERQVMMLLRGRGGVVSLHELQRALGDGAALDQARESLARKLILFHDLNAETLEVEVGFLHAVRRELSRQTTGRTLRDTHHAA